MQCPEILSMQSRMGVALLTLLTLFFSSGCNATMQQEVIVSQCDSEVHLKQGNVLVVRLESQMTAGYLWSAGNADDGVLLMMGEPKIERKPSDIDGGSETQVFRFKAETPGKTMLDFQYRHPWKTKTPPLKQCTFSIAVEKE